MQSVRKSTDTGVSLADVIRGRATIAAFGAEHQRLFAAANERLVRQLAIAKVGKLVEL